MREKENEAGFQVDGMSIAPGVVETIISLAAAEVQGVAGVGQAGTLGSIAAAFNAGRAIPTAGIKVNCEDNGEVTVQITVQALYGYRLTDIAAGVRQAIADALRGQIGVDVSAVDVHIDGLTFEE